MMERKDRESDSFTGSESAHEHHSAHTTAQSRRDASRRFSPPTKTSSVHSTQCSAALGPHSASPSLVGSRVGCYKTMRWHFAARVARVAAPSFAFAPSPRTAAFVF